MYSPSQELLVLLDLASSDDDTKRKHAENRIAEIERIPNYWPNLLQIYFETSVNQKIRMLAIICLKNGVAKYWRKSAVGAIAENEKQIIRQLFMSNFSETQKQLSSQQSLVISMIARFDFPIDWPDLLAGLIPLVEQSFSQNPDVIIQLNTLYTLYLCMKQIATKALPSARKSLRDVTPSIFNFMHNLFKNRIQFFFELQISESNYDALNAALSIARVALKCMRKLITHGFSSILDSPGALELLASLYHYLPHLLETKTNVPASIELFKTLGSMSVLVGKLYLDVEEGSVVDFILAPHCIDVIKYYWGLLEHSNDNSAADPIMEKILIQSLKMLKNVVKHPALSSITPSNILF
jgi:hypothetical protein